MFVVGIAVRKKRRNLKESGGVSNIVPHSALSGYANLILIYRRSLGLGLLHPLELIHLLCAPKKPNNKQTLMKRHEQEKYSERRYESGVGVTVLQKSAGREESATSCRSAKQKQPLRFVCGLGFFFCFFGSLRLGFVCSAFKSLVLQI